MIAFATPLPTHFQQTVILRTMRTQMSTWAGTSRTRDAVGSTMMLGTGASFS